MFGIIKGLMPPKVPLMFTNDLPLESNSDGVSRDAKFYNLTHIVTINAIAVRRITNKAIRIDGYEFTFMACKRPSVGNKACNLLLIHLPNGLFLYIRMFMRVSPCKSLTFEFFI